jgi:hypothetical protein
MASEISQQGEQAGAHTGCVVHCSVTVVLDALQNMRQYLTGLTANLAKHTITDVQHEDRVSLLLKDSFIESFAPKERPFVRQFVVSFGSFRTAVYVAKKLECRASIPSVQPRKFQFSSPRRKHKCSRSSWYVQCGWVVAACLG